MNVENFVDLHVHIGPEPIPRKYNTLELVIKETGKLKAIGLKNHFYATVPFLKEINSKSLELIGGIVLNNYVGGINPYIVYACAKLSDNPIIVWFPTINAENFLQKSIYEIRPEWCESEIDKKLSKDVTPVRITKNGVLRKETLEVLKAIRKNKCILATGHISWQESVLLIKEALKMGISKIIITHPIYQLIDMPIEIQKELVKNKGVYIEQSYSMYLIDNISIEKISDQIKIIGPDSCIITSDMGQVNSPDPSKALQEFTELLKEKGITEEELRIMGEINPRKLIEKIDYLS